MYMFYVVGLGNPGEKLNEKRRASDYFEFTSEFVHFLKRIPGRVNINLCSI